MTFLKPRLNPSFRRAFLTVCKSAPDGRPTLDDVLRISEGKGAKVRGTGSRQVPHRLNTEERSAFNIARQKGFLTIKGSGYRKERKGAPLANIYRQLQDALAHPVIVIQQGMPLDTVLVDLSTLRQIDISKVENTIKATLEAEYSLSPVPKSKLVSPFTIILPTESLELIDLQNNNNSSTENISSTTTAEDDDDTISIEESTSKMLDTAEEEGNNSEQLEAIEAALTLPIWQQPPRLIGFECDRPEGKAVAKTLVDVLAIRD